MTRFWAALCVLVVLAGVACTKENEAPKPDSDSQQNYQDGRIPVDDNVYVISGEVQAVNSLVRQESPAQGSISVINGSGGGSFVGETNVGKGFIRVKVSSVAPATNLATIGRVVILKTTDTKAAVLTEGDVVEFKCRAQFEAIAAVRENETWDSAKGTWELDYCRLSSPVLGPG